MGNDLTTYGFWFWSGNLKGVLTMLGSLTEYHFLNEDLDAIENGLMGTNDEKNIWYDYKFSEKNNEVSFKLAYDDEETTELIHIRIHGSIELIEKVELLDRFQSLFKNLELRN